MITLEDCVAFCGLTEEEVLAIAEHEHMPEIAATAFAEYLTNREHGTEKIRDMIVDDIRAAQARNDKEHVLTLLHVLHHFLKTHHAVLLATLLSCSVSLPTVLAEESTGPEMRIVVGYRIDLDNFNLGSFRFTTTLNGSDYRVQGAGHFSILGGLLYDLRTSAASSGKVTNTGPEPTTYMLSYAGGGDSGQLRMTFDTGAITAVSIVPRRERDPREIPTTKDQLVGALDPIAAAFFRARSNDPTGDLKVCDQTVPVFDGAWRYDLVLAPKRKAPIRKQASTGYASYAVVCKVKFKPISGYAPDDPNIKVMAYADDIEVWLVPLSGTDMYVPYHLRLPTDSGLLSVTSTTLRIEGNPLSKPSP